MLKLFAFTFFAFSILILKPFFLVSPVLAVSEANPIATYKSCLASTGDEGLCATRFPLEKAYADCNDSGGGSCLSDYVISVTSSYTSKCSTISPTDPEVCQGAYRLGSNFANCVTTYKNPSECDSSFGYSKGVAPAPRAAGAAPAVPTGCDAATGDCPAAGIIQAQELLTRMINISVTIAFMALTVWLVWGALKFFIISGGDPKAISHAWQSVTWAFMGLFFLVLAYLVLRLIADVTGANVTQYCLGFKPYCI